MENETGTVAPAKTPKPVGMEKLVVRLFREKFGRACQRAGILAPTLDEFLRTVLSHGEAQKTDKDYARKAYKEMIVWVGGTGLPDWAKDKTAETAHKAAVEAAEMLGDDPPPPPVPAPKATPEATPEPKADLFDDTSDFASLLDDIDAPVDPMLADDSPLRAALTEFIKAGKKRHPFCQSFYIGKERFVAVGTMFGKVERGAHMGEKMNIQGTVNPHRSFQRCPPEVVYQSGGRVLNLYHEDEETEERKYVFVVRHKPGRKIRWWGRVNNQDVPGLARFVVLTDDAQGWKLVTRAEF
jgi:hypothetical protein